MSGRRREWTFCAFAVSVFGPLGWLQHALSDNHAHVSVRVVEPYPGPGGHSRGEPHLWLGSKLPYTQQGTPPVVRVRVR